MLRVAALCAFSILLPAVASAEGDFNSTNWVMPGCRSFGQGIDNPVPGIMKGYCAGVVTGIMATHPGLCGFPGITRGQVVAVVVQYIDARPARLHEPFPRLAFEALKAAWPCRDKARADRAEAGAKSASR